MDSITITVIQENGLIFKEKVGLFQDKTVFQILTDILKVNPEDYILALRTSTRLEVLQMDTVPLKKFPALKTKNTTDQFYIPESSLCVLNSSDKDKDLFLIYPVSINNDNITFLPFIYGFSKDDHSKSIQNILPKITEHFDLNISNPKLYLNNHEITDIKCSSLIHKLIETKSEIQFHFELSDKAVGKIKHRQELIAELIRTEKEFCRDLTLFRNQVGERLLDEHVFTIYEHKIVFNSIAEMLESSARFATALDGRESYSSSIANIILSLLPILKESFKEYFANFHSKEMIPEILDKHKNNPQLIAIMQRSFENKESTLQSMAIKPIQHFPRYKLFANDLKKNTPKSHPDHLLYSKVIEEIDKTIHELNNYHLVRDVRFLHERLKPLKEYANQRLNIKGRSLITKYCFNRGVFSNKNILYLLSDIILYTEEKNNIEEEKFRSTYDNFFYIPVPSTTSIYVYYQNNFDIIKFSSIKEMDEMISNVIALRKNAFEANPEKNNLLKAIEYISYSQQNGKQMIDSSCCKIGNFIFAASYRFYLTYDTHHEDSLYIGNDVKNIHLHAKLVNVDKIPIPYIYGGEKYPLPLEYNSEKRFTDIKSKTVENDSLENLHNVIPLKQLKEGRMYHTCCSYKKYIVIYGGYKRISMNQKKFFPDVYFYNVETQESFVSNPSPSKEPEPRYKHSAIVYKNLMIIHGGVNARNDTILNDTWCFNFNDGMWTLLDLKNKAYIVPRFGHSAVCVNHFMFIIGGATYLKGEPTSIPIKAVLSDNKSDQLNEPSENNSVISLNEEEEEEENDIQVIRSSVNNNLMPAPNCFCIDIESCNFINVNIIGNFLPGLSLFSAIFDDYNNQIIIFGGSDVQNKVHKDAMIITKISIPRFYTSASIPEGDVNVQKLSSIAAASKLKHRKSHATLNINYNLIDTSNPREEQMKQLKIEKSRSNALIQQPKTPKIRKVAFQEINVKLQPEPQTPQRPGPSFKKNKNQANDADDDDVDEENDKIYDIKSPAPKPDVDHDDNNDDKELEIENDKKSNQTKNRSSPTSKPKKRTLNPKNFKPHTVPHIDNEPIQALRPKHKRSSSDMPSSIDFL